MKTNIGFVSTRFCGTDGVTLETSKWAEVFEQSGYNCFYFAGELDRRPEISLLAPEAHFKSDQNEWINKHVYGKSGREPHVTEAIHAYRAILKERLHHFIRKFDIHMLIAENALSLPMHLPLGLALAETIAETQLPTIGHHHDFFWERSRYLTNGVSDYLGMAFPPNLPQIRHVVINSTTRQELAHRTGISSTLIPNVLDFENPPSVNEKRVKAFRDAVGLKADDVVVLQPTRIVQRKGIEQAIDLVKALDIPNCKLVISHEAGDEGYEYFNWLQSYAQDNNVDLRQVELSIGDPWNGHNDHKTRFNLWDVYPIADFITYPSLCEGFGNALLEAIYFKKPLLVNRYATYIRDIEPHGFDLALMDGFLGRDTIEHVRSIILSEELRQAMVSHNYNVATQHFSYGVLRQQLNTILTDCFGIQVRKLFAHNTHGGNILHLHPRPNRERIIRHSAPQQISNPMV
jgi:glycosyltransferase involved in cell wall biosynthesis